MLKTIPWVLAGMVLIASIAVASCVGQPYRSSAGLGVPPDETCLIELDRNCYKSLGPPYPELKPSDKSSYDFYQMAFCRRSGNLFQIPTTSHGSSRGSDYYKIYREIVEIEPESTTDVTIEEITILRVDKIKNIRCFVNDKEDMEHGYYRDNKKDQNHYILLGRESMLTLFKLQDSHERTLYNFFYGNQQLGNIGVSKNEFNENLFGVKKPILNDHIINGQNYLPGHPDEVEILRSKNRYYVPCVVHVGDYLRDKPYVMVENSHSPSSLSELFDESKIEKAAFVSRDSVEGDHNETLVLKYGNERRIGRFLYDIRYSYRPWSRGRIRITRPED